MQKNVECCPEFQWPEPTCHLANNDPSWNISIYISLESSPNGLIDAPSSHLNSIESKPHGFFTSQEDSCRRPGEVCSRHQLFFLHYARRRSWSSSLCVWRCLCYCEKQNDSKNQIVITHRLMFLRRSTAVAHANVVLGCFPTSSCSLYRSELTARPQSLIGLWTLEDRCRSYR